MREVCVPQGDARLAELVGDRAVGALDPRVHLVLRQRVVVILLPLVIIAALAAAAAAAAADVVGF